MSRVTVNFWILLRSRYECGILVNTYARFVSGFLRGSQEVEMDVEHVTAVCTGLGSLRESGSGRAVYVKHADCLGMYCETQLSYASLIRIMFNTS